MSKRYPAERIGTWLMLTALLSVSAAPALAERRPEKFEGRRLAEALRTLQARGLRIVFSSEVVTAKMDVVAEPRAHAARAMLDELLAPHGLQAVEGPGDIIQIIRASGVAPVSRRPLPLPASGAVRGQVVDAASGSPLPDAVVRLVATRHRTHTDEAGRFHLSDVRAGAHTLQVSMTGYAPETRAIRIAAARTLVLTVDLTQRIASYSERLTVTAHRSDWRDLGGGPETSLGRRELHDMRGTLTDDPLRAIHTLPRVAASDDFKSEFSVRGSPYRHLGVVIDGVATPWLQHTAYGRGDVGSLTMLGGDLLDGATLQAGARPQRDGNRLGAQLALTLREGSRDAARLHGALGGTNTALAAEGPLGGSARGSWLVSLRQSYLAWPIRPQGELSGTVFGFTDGLAKLVYDVAPTEQVSVSVLGGQTSIDERDDLGPHELGDGTNRAGVLNVGWRSMFGPGLVLNQRAYVVVHQFLNKTQTGQAAGRGAHRELSYRADVLRDVFGGLLEAGAQVQRMEGGSRSPLIVDRPDEPSWIRSGYLHVTWSPASRLTMAPGIRIADSSLVGRRTVSPWMLGAWSLAPGWTLNAGASVSHQFPEFEYERGEARSLRLRPERAAHVDLGVEQRLGQSTRWQATFFAREERDALRQPEPHPRLVGGMLIQPAVPSRLENALSGSARGVELLLERRGATGLSGWVAYSYGRTRYSDATRGETFWGDFDQRHAITLSGSYRLSERASVAVTFRGGTNFPVPGYLVARDGGLFVGERRNGTRLPAYARLDLRASRSFTCAGRHFTLFAEVLNVLNRTNVGLADGFVRRETGEAVGFTEALLPRLPSAGLVVRF